MIFESVITLAGLVGCVTQPPMKIKTDGCARLDGTAERVDYPLPATLASSVPTYRIGGERDSVNTYKVHIPATEEWDAKRMGRRLETLIAKSALGRANRAEEAEKAHLMALRRKRYPARSYDEIRNYAERTRILREVIDGLKQYEKLS